MNRKELVLQHLQQAGARDVSGQELAQELGVSRTAVWKIIKSLQREGYEIAAGSNRGYRLLKGPDRLDAAAIAQALPAMTWIRCAPWWSTHKKPVHLIRIPPPRSLA